MLKESDIVYETDNYWIYARGLKGFEVYRKTITHSERVAIIGYQGEKGLERAKAEIQRREGD